MKHGAGTYPSTERRGHILSPYKYNYHLSEKATVIEEISTAHVVGQ